MKAHSEINKCHDTTGLDLFFVTQVPHPPTQNINKNSVMPFFNWLMAN